MGHDGADGWGWLSKLACVVLDSHPDCYRAWLTDRPHVPHATNNNNNKLFWDIPEGHERRVRIGHKWPGGRSKSSQVIHTVSVECVTSWIARVCENIHSTLDEDCENFKIRLRPASDIFTAHPPSSTMCFVCVCNLVTFRINSRAQQQQAVKKKMWQRKDGWGIARNGLIVSQASASKDKLVLSIMLYAIRVSVCVYEWHQFNFAFELERFFFRCCCCCRVLCCYSSISSIRGVIWASEAYLPSLFCNLVAAIRCPLCVFGYWLRFDGRHTICLPAQID